MKGKKLKRTGPHGRQPDLEQCMRGEKTLEQGALQYVKARDWHPDQLKMFLNNPGGAFAASTFRKLVSNRTAMGALKQIDRRLGSHRDWLEIARAVETLFEGAQASKYRLTNLEDRELHKRVADTSKRLLALLEQSPYFCLGKFHVTVNWETGESELRHLWNEEFATSIRGLQELSLAAEQRAGHGAGGRARLHERVRGRMAQRTFFIRALTQYFRTRFRTPLRLAVAEITETLFEESVSERVVGRVAP